MLKAWLLDDTDIFTAQEKLAEGRKKYAEFDWVRFDEGLYTNSNEAYKSLINDLCTKSIFCPGKIIYCYGMPFRKSEHYAKLIKEIPKIPENVCFIIIVRPDKGSILYKGLKALAQAKVDEPLNIDKNNAIEWIMVQAGKLGLKIDNQACGALADITSFNPAKIQQELRKLKELTTDNTISIRLIEIGGFGDGHSDIRDLGSAIISNDGVKAHEYLQRLLDKGEPALKICGFLQDWITKLAIAQSSRGNFEVIKETVSGFKKWEKDDVGVHETIDDERWGHFSRWKGETVSMYNNPNALYYSCKELRESKKKANWAYGALNKMGKLQELLRKGGMNEVKLLHAFVADLIG